MTSNPRGKKAGESRDASKAASASPRSLPAQSDTPPPFSLPNTDDDDAGWLDPREDRQATGTPPTAVSRPLFTPSFTLVGSGPIDASRQAGQAGLLVPGSTFGVYSVGACIGEGGMARVYQAEHAGLRRQVALKVLIDGFARDLDGRERFLREARLAAAIKHPNVVNIFDVGLHDDIPYLVMEFLEGQDLERLLTSKGALDESFIVDVMIPVVAGLSAVHDAGIVHRDLKPGNIFLAKGRYNDLEPKLLDFGISKAQGPEQMKLTANRGVMGTPFYISPEGLHGGEMTPLSDQYSLAVVMYECATGCTPYNASGFSELSRLIVSGQYTPPTTHKPELSKRLARIIERAMSLQPQDRFRDMREMGRELLSLAGQRTRVTWALSFGDLHSNGTVRSAGANESKDVPPQAAKPSRRLKPFAPWLIAPALLLLVLLAWRTGIVSFNAGFRSSAAAGLNSSPRPEVKNGTQPAAGVAAPDPIAHATLAAIAAPTGPAEADSKASVTADYRWKASTRGGEGRAAHADSAQLGVPPNPLPSGRRQTRLGSDSELDWALPATSPPPSQTNFQVGPNGSPIFD